jgi:ribosomal protein L1
MRKYGKKYQEAQKLVETGKSYTIAEASELIKKSINN